MKTLFFLFTFLFFTACGTPQVYFERAPADAAQVQLEGPVGIYSGTFDPIHLGHVESAEALAGHAGLRQIVLIPNFDPKGKNPLSVEQRWNLIALAVKDKPHFILPSLDVLMQLNLQPNPIEAARAWVEARLKPGSPVFHMMGDDSFVKLTENPAAQERLRGKDRWQFLVLRRSADSTVTSRLANVQFFDPRLNAELSSSLYRQDPLLGEGLLNKAVALEIKRLHLYGRGDERGLYGLPQNLTDYIYYEQWLNQRIEDTDRFASINEGNTLPKSFMPENRPVFRIYTVDVPEEHIVSFGQEQAPEQIRLTKDGKRFIRFFIHPVSKPFFENALKNYEWRSDYLATPLSSHRSLIVWNPHDQSEPMSIKVTLDATIGETRRLLTRKQIQRGYVISALLRTIEPVSLHRHGIYMVDEPSGFYLKNFEFGFSTRALPQTPPGTSVLPMFSLYSKPAMGLPPLAEMIRKSGLEPRPFLQRYVIDRMVEQTMILAMEHGLVGEPHEQNVLMEVKHGQPTGNFHYRDFGGFTVNENYRKKIGKDMAWMPAGIDPEALKAERADVLNALKGYLRESNFFALQKSMSVYFPEVTQKWVEETYRSALGKQIEKYFGQNESRYPEIKKIMREASPFYAPSCRGVFL